jgi:hypothetical protein
MPPHPENRKHEPEEAIGAGQQKQPPTVAELLRRLQSLKHVLLA